VQTEKKNWFRTLCKNNGINPTDEQLDQMEHYVQLLLDWNKKINLISRKDEDNAWTSHILHSVSLLFKMKLMKGGAILDLGSGGGLPGIPIKILQPDISLLCLDATKKKVHAVSQMIGELKLLDANAAWGRAEDIVMQTGYLHAFDYVLARAVCQLDELLPLSKNFLRKKDQTTISLNTLNGTIVDSHPPAVIAFKGGDLKQELDRAKRKFPSVNIKAIDLSFSGSEQLVASDKKILLIHF
jgi:16S rRNA (guanine527-N7)-methyltransferase